MHYNTINADWKITSQPLLLGVKSRSETVFQTFSPSKQSDYGGQPSHILSICGSSRAHNIFGLSGERTYKPTSLRHESHRTDDAGTKRAPMISGQATRGGIKSFDR